MNDTPGRQLRFRLVPWPLLLIAAVFLLMFAYAWHEGSLHGAAWMLLAAPALIGLVFEVSTLTLDPFVRQVMIRRARAWGASERRLSFDDVTAVAVEESSSGRGRTYGVVFVLRSGERVPVRTGTSSGAASKQRLARRLAEALNQGRSTPVQLALDGTVRESQAGSADGIEWTLDLVSHGNGWDVTRFSTDAARLDDGFVFIAPTPAKGGPPPLAGAFGALVRGFLRQHLRGLELSEADLPQLERAVALENELLTRSGLAASTSCPDAAREWVDAGAAALLAEWQQRPLDGSERTASPHLVLGPGGLRLIFRASLRSEPDLARVRDLGLALARLTQRVEAIAR